MKKLHAAKIATCLVALAVLLTILPSFSARPGGEGFEIYLNNKLVLQQFGDQMRKVSELKLDPASAGDQLTVKYYHCGQPGHARYIMVKNQENKTLKEWHYGDASSANNSMAFKVHDLSGLEKKNGTRLGLYYSSKEIPNGRMLAAIQLRPAALASR